MGPTGNGNLALLCALALFVLFFTNVATGAAGLGVFLADKAEMLTLFAAVVFFVVGILAREAAARARADRKRSEREEH